MIWSYRTVDWRGISQQNLNDSAKPIYTFRIRHISMNILAQCKHSGVGTSFGRWVLHCFLCRIISACRNVSKDKILRLLCEFDIIKNEIIEILKFKFWTWSVYTWFSCWCIFQPFECQRKIVEYFTNNPYRL